MQDDAAKQIPNINAELNISDYTQPIKLHCNQKKFWHIWLTPTERNVITMKTGKIINQIDEDEDSIDYHEKVFDNEKQAIEAIKRLISEKRLKGYELYLANPKKRKFEEEKTSSNQKQNSSVQKPQSNVNTTQKNNNEQKHSMEIPQNLNHPGIKPAIYDSKLSSKEGEYLESPIDDNDFHFFQVEIQGNYLKITKGKSNAPQSNESSYHQYSTESDAKNNAIHFVGGKLAYGFTRNPKKFKSTFTPKDLQDFKASVALQMQQAGGQQPPKKPAPKINVNNSDMNIHSLMSLSSIVDDDPLFRGNNFLQLPNNGGRGRPRNKDNYSMTSKVSEFSDISESMRSYNNSPAHSRNNSRSPSAHSNRTENLGDSNSQNDFNSTNTNSREPTRLGKPVDKPHAVLLADTWEDKVDPTGYLMSEKLDGVRCLWTGKHLYSRNGNRFFAPEWFTRNWPNAVLDGELWIARNTFQQCVRVVKKKEPESNEWKKIQYLVFDAPSLNLPFSERYKIMDEELSKLTHTPIRLVKNRICNSRKDMDEELKKVLALSGEGLMLRNPKSMYEQKRSKNLLKVKVFLDDEALVIGHLRRPEGDLKAMQVRLKNGKEFKIGGGLTDAERRHPPKIGTMVTFKYQNLSEDGIPRFPIYIRPYDKL